MYTTIRTLIASFVLAPLALASPQIGYPVAKTVDATTLQPIAGVSVVADRLGVVDVSVADADGFAALPGIQLPAPPSVPIIQDSDPVYFEVNHPGYLPLHRAADLNSAGARTTLQLVPRNDGIVSPLISAATGGRFHLPGAGFLRVSPGALSQDARIRLIPIHRASSSPHKVSDELIIEIWAAAVDEFGAEIQALPSVFGGIQLERNLPPMIGIPVGASRTWSAHRFDESWSETESNISSVTVNASTATFPIASGFTILRGGLLFPFEPPAGGGTCNWGSWEFTFRPKTAAIPSLGGQNVSVNCGIYANTVSVSVSEGQTQSTSVGVSVASAASVGLESDTLFAEVSAQVGLTVTGSLETGSATTTMTGSTKGTPPSGTVSGQNQSDMEAPWSCISGTANYGVEVVEYWMTAQRKCYNSEGELLEIDTQTLGTVSVPGSITIDWDADIDPACGEDCEDAALPNMPV